MSIWYVVAGVLILNDSVWPTFTLIDVANPWIVESPMPVTCQSLGGSPGNAFSHATGFAHEASAGDGAVPASPSSTIAASDAIIVRRRTLIKQTKRETSAAIAPIRPPMLAFVEYRVAPLTRQ